jgi:hypothetical protein
MGTLKKGIQHEVHLLEPKYVEHAFSVATKVESKNMATKRVITHNYIEQYVPLLISLNLQY